ncbi:MAG: hypothetical protein ACSLEL_03910 [Candidatus Malihini olakiniferum]
MKRPLLHAGSHALLISENVIAKKELEGIAPISSQIAQINRQ